MYLFALIKNILIIPVGAAAKIAARAGLFNVSAENLTSEIIIPPRAKAGINPMRIERVLCGVL